MKEFQTKSDGLHFLEKTMEKRIKEYMNSYSIDENKHLYIYSNFYHALEAIMKHKKDTHQITLEDLEPTLQLIESFKRQAE